MRALHAHLTESVLGCCETLEMAPRQLCEIGVAVKREYWDFAWRRELKVIGA